jgi:flagellar biosynthesis protein FlhF
MRIKSFTGKTMAEAMDQVRADLGEEAIILSTQDMPDGMAQVTAAIEKKDPPKPTIPEKPNGAWAQNWDSDWKVEATAKKETPFTPASAEIGKQIPLKAKAKTTPKPKPKAVSAVENETFTVTPQVETLIQAMAYHGIPTLLAERLCRSALAAQTDNTEMALAASLDHHFKFTPQFSRKNTPVMLVGPPGVGKTMAIAKMAASATMAGRKVHVVTTDKSRAGAVEQLKSFTNILELKLWVADDPNSLARILSSEPLQDGSHVLIDTGGISCYEDSELAQIAELIIAGKAEAVAVLAAGSDSAEMSDTAAKFASIGAKRLVITRLDTTRRYGGIFTAADKANLSFSYASVSPSVARGLHMLNPVNLARLLLRDPTQQGVRNEFDKAEK